MNGVNKVILLGHVGKEPEIKTLDNGTKIARFSLATTETVKRDGQKHEYTEWHTIVAWRGMADIVEKIIHKGTLVYLEGKLKSRSWEDENKVRRSVVEIELEILNNLSKKTESNSNSNSESQGHSADHAVKFESEKEGELPF
jgi:single-strand DNA-binding protein